METLATSNAYVVDRNVWVNSTAGCGDGWFDGGCRYVGRRHIITIECFNFLARMSATCFFQGVLVSAHIMLVVDAARSLAT